MPLSLLSINVVVTNNNEFTNDPFAGSTDTTSGRTSVDFSRNSKLIRYVNSFPALSLRVISTMYWPVSCSGGKLNVILSTPLSCPKMFGISMPSSVRFIDPLLDAKSTPLPVPSVTLISSSLKAVVSMLPSAGVMDVITGTRVS